MKTKVAIVVGHSARSQGAVRQDTGETEFEWNSDLAELIRSEAEAFFDDIEVKVFFRQYVGSYRKEIERVYAEVDAWGAHFSIELHFNSHHNPNASGSEVLSSGSKRSLALAEAMQAEFVKVLGNKDRGVKVRRNGRGGKSLISGRAPAIITEPFFGSSRKGLAATDERHEKVALARATLRAVRAVA